MERSQVLDAMGELKHYGMRAADDEIIANAVKRQHELQRLVGDPLDAEINETLVRDLAAEGFLEQQRKVVLIGGSGTAKRQTAIAIALARSLAKERRDPSATGGPVLGRERDDVRCRRVFVGPSARQRPLVRPMLSHHATGEPLRDDELLPDAIDARTAARRPQSPFGNCFNG